MEKGAGSTPATVQLEKAGVPFKTYEYAHSNDHMDDGYGVEAATQARFDEHPGVQDAVGGHRAPNAWSAWCRSADIWI